MKKLLLTLALLLAPAVASAQCNGVFPNGTVCGNNTGASNTPRAVSPASLQGAAGGLNGQVQYNNSGVLGGLTNTQLTALINPFSSTLSGAVPVGGTNPLLFLNQTGAWTSPLLRQSNPGNFYVLASGSDSNNCLTLGTACATIQRPFNLIQNFYDLQGATATVNVGAGTFAGAVLTGPLTGPVALVGAGSASTIISPSNAGTCATLSHALEAIYWAQLTISSVSLNSACTGGDGLLVAYYAAVFLGNSDVKFTGANNALINVINYAIFNASSFPLNITGGATFGFLLSTHATAITGVGVTNTITGTPAFTVFLDAIDHSFFNLGSSSSWSGSATGTRYAMALNSIVDSEQITQALPGSTPGQLSSGSYYYTTGSGGSGGQAICIGGTGGCRIATAPTGFGTGAAFSFGLGADDQQGSVSATMGTSPSTSGTLHIATASLLQGPLGAGGQCTVGLSNAGSQWPNGTTVQSFYASGTGDLQITYSGTTAPTASNSYAFNWVCG